MELHQLEYFVAVAETASFSRGAERCCVAQPSLSQQIAKLERELGQPLFDRLGRRIALTHAGRLLLEQARPVLAGVAAMKRSMAEDARTESGRLVVGAIPTIAPYLLPKALREFRRQCPLAELVVTESLTPDVIEGLVSAELDVTILSLPLNDDRIAFEALMTEPLLLAVSRDHPLAAAKKARTTDLERYPAIVLREMHCLGQQIQAFCGEHRISPRIFCRTTQLATIQSLVSLGLGVSLVPRMLAEADSSGNVIYLPFAEEAAPARAIVVAWHPLRAPSPLVSAFIEAIRRVCRRNSPRRRGVGAAYRGSAARNG